MKNEIPPWIDLIEGEVCVETCEVQSDGGVKILTNSVTLTNSGYGEVCKKSGDDVVTTTYPSGSNITLAVGEIIYSVRLYSAELSLQDKAFNATLDQTRFCKNPSNSLEDADGCVILDADGNYIIMQD